MLSVAVLPRPRLSGERVARSFFPRRENRNYLTLGVFDVIAGVVRTRAAAAAATGGRGSVVASGSSPRLLDRRCGDGATSYLVLRWYALGATSETNGLRSTTSRRFRQCSSTGTCGGGVVVDSFGFGKGSNRMQSHSPRRFVRECHDPSFMEGSSSEDLEVWLNSLLESSDREESAASPNVVSADAGADASLVGRGGVDCVAYLRVLESIARSGSGGGSGQAPRKAENWIGRLERHYASEVEAFREIYGKERIVVVPALLPPTTVAQSQTSPISPFSAFLSSKRQPRHHQPVAVGGETTAFGADIDDPVDDDDDRPDIRRKLAASFVRSLQPTADCYNAVIEAWSGDNNEISVVRARRWLSKLEEAAVAAAAATNGLQSGGAEEGGEASPGAATELGSPLRPNIRSYNLYLRACSRGLGKKPDVWFCRATEAEGILRNLLSPQSQSSPGVVVVRPDTESFNYVLRAWTRCRTDETAADRVMDWLREMEQMQRNAGDAAKMGEEEAHEEEDSSSSSWKVNIRPNTKTYAIAMDAWTIAAGIKAKGWYERRLAAAKKKNYTGGVERRRDRSGKDQGVDISEDGTGYVNVANDNDDGTEEMGRAESILGYVRALQQAGLADVNAGIVAHNTLLSGWSRCANEFRPEVPRRSEVLLREMMTAACEDAVAVDVTSYNAVIKAWTRIKRNNSADRAEWWLDKMLEGDYYGNDDDRRERAVRPNVNTYNLVMDAWFQRGDPARVEDLLLELDAAEGLAPNTDSFSKAIRAWLKDELDSSYGFSGSSLENAWKWLEELMRRERRGDPLVTGNGLFSAVLKTAAKTSARGGNVLSVAQSAFAALSESRFGADAFAYAWLLQTGLKVLSSPEHNERREEFASSLVRQCCDDGLLSVRLVRELANGPVFESGWTAGESARICEKFIGGPPFPPMWCRNLPSNHRIPEMKDLIRTRESS